MGLEIKVPTVGESITEVTISEWLKQEGEYVEMDEVLCELESDKATFELNAEESGILHIKAQPGDTLGIGDVIAEIDNQADKPAEEGKKTGTKKENKPTAIEKTGEVVEMSVPSVGESISEVTVANWLKQDGDQVALDEVISEIESDKATFELTAEAQGILRIVAAEGETLKVGALICKIEVTTGDIQEEEELEEKHSGTVSYDQSNGSGSHASGHPSPAAAKILAEKGISAEEVKGTGVDGRITKEDAMNATSGANKPASPSKQENASEKPSGDRPQTRKKMSNLRKTVARRLVSVKNEMAMLTTFNEVDMKPVMDLRKKYKDKFKEKYEVNLGFMSFFVKASCMALQEWPAVNAMIDGDEIVYNEFYDVSIAVSTPKGLVVPVIRDADKLDFQGVEKKIIELATKGRDGKLSIEEMQGGTFTITNGGVFGSMLSTPIINSPQAAILGMHNIVERPVAINGEVLIRPIMYVALSYDHRLIDGRESVSFLYRIKELLEDPSRLLLGI